MQAFLRCWAMLYAMLYGPLFDLLSKLLFQAAAFICKLTMHCYAGAVPQGFFRIRSAVRMVLGCDNQHLGIAGPVQVGAHLQVCEKLHSAVWLAERAPDQPGAIMLTVRPPSPYLCLSGSHRHNVVQLEPCEVGSKKQIWSAQQSKCVGGWCFTPMASHRLEVTTGSLSCGHDGRPVGLYENPRHCWILERVSKFSSPSSGIATSQLHTPASPCFT